MTPEVRQNLANIGTAVVIAVIPILVVRYLSNPDALTTFRMKVASNAEEFAMGKAKMWADRADMMHSVYEAARP